MPSSLLTGLVSAWPLDETSGTRNDAYGTNHLTDNNTVGSASKGGGAPANMPETVADFVAANSEYLAYSPSSPDVIPSTGSWSEAYWFKHTGENYAGILGDTTASSNGHVLFSRNNGTVDLYMSGGSDTILNEVAAAGAWHLAVVTYTTGTNAVALTIDNGTPITDVLVGPYVPVTAQSLRFGQSARGAYYTGLLSGGDVWSRAITADERTDLWNDGNGFFYPFSVDPTQGGARRFSSVARSRR